MSSDNKFVRSLIENAKQGNNAAIEQLFQMNLGKIYAVALRLTADKSLAEIITQGTFITAWKKINLVRSDASFLKWLIAITVYQTIDSLRTKKQKQIVDHNELRELESKDELDKYILALPEQERMIFVLNKIEGYSIEEISDMIGIKKDQANIHLDIAIAKLIESESSLKSEDVLREKISKVIPEMQPPVEVHNGIFTYIMDEKIREQKEQEQIAKAFADKEKLEKASEEISEEKEPIFIEEIKSKKISSINFELIRRSGYGILTIAVIVVAYKLITSPSEWEVISISGQPMLENRLMQKSDDLELMNTIRTDHISSLTLMIPELGKLLIDSSTSISRTKNSDEIKLDKGLIKKFEGNASDILTVITPLATCTELYKGSSFKLNVNSDGSSMLIVESGWVVVNINEFNSYVPKNYNCLISKGKYAIPYPSDANLQMAGLFQNFSGFKDPALGTILSIVTKKEVLSLWHIIQLISEESRPIAYDKLNQLIPAPTEVTKEGIVVLNKTMLLKWRQEIELKMD